MMRRAFALALISLLLSISLVACNGKSTQEVRGVLVDVKSQELIEWESITVQRKDGKQFTFTRGTEVDLRFWRASHLKDHMNGVQPVTVVYKKDGGTLVAVEVRD